MDQDFKHTPPKRHRSLDGIRPFPRPIYPTIEKEQTKPQQNPSQSSATNNNLFPMAKDKVDQDKKLAGNGQESILNKTIAGSLASSMNLPDKPHKKTRKKRSKLKLAVWTVVIVLIAGIGAGAWDAWQLYHKLNHLTVGNLTPSVGGTENILVAGSTNRCNLKVQNSQWGFCSDGVTGVNSDVIFIVHLDPSKGTASVLSIPRDTFVPNARSGDQAFKIDAALYQGPTQLVQAVEQDFGIPIQHYAEVGFDGFVNIVNAVGGIKMDFPEAVYDSESYLNVQQPGCYLLNGVQALQVVRARHLQYKAPGITTNDTYYWPQEAESDIARIARTHEFLRVLASTVATQNIKDPIVDQRLVDAIAPQVQVDSGFSTSTMISLAQTFHSLNPNNVPQYTLPIADVSSGSYDYEGENMGDVVFPVAANDRQTIDEFLGESSNTDTMNGQTLPSATGISVNVVNGSGISDQAAAVSSALGDLGFNMVGQPGSATPVSSQAVETVVYYSSQATEGDALAVASQLNGYVVLSQDANMATSGSDVTVLTGSGLSVNPPSSTSSAKSNSTTGSASSTTASPSTVTQPASTVLSQAEAQYDISAPTPNNQGLSAWDPIACSPGQKAIVDPNI